MKRYRGILFIAREMTAKLGGGGRGLIWHARLQGERVELLWSSGKTSYLDWRVVREKAGLALPPPCAAFSVVPERDAVGLLFESATPTGGLRYHEPHSVVFPLGWLTPQGLREPAD